KDQQPKHRVVAKFLEQWAHVAPALFSAPKISRGAGKGPGRSQGLKFGDFGQSLISRVRTNVRRRTSKITAVDHPNSNMPFIAVRGPSSRQRSTGSTSP